MSILPLLLIKSMITQVYSTYLTTYNLLLSRYYFKRNGEATNPSCWAHCLKKMPIIPQQNKKYATALRVYTTKRGLLQCLSIITFLNLRFYFKCHLTGMTLFSELLLKKWFLSLLKFYCPSFKFLNDWYISGSRSWKASGLQSLEQWSKMLNICFQYWQFKLLSLWLSFAKRSLQKQTFFDLSNYEFITYTFSLPPSSLH